MTTRWLTHRQDGGKAMGGGGGVGVGVGVGVGKNTWVSDSVSVDLPSAQLDGMPETTRPPEYADTQRSRD